MKIWLLSFIAISLIVPSMAIAKDYKDQIPEPKTKLEEFSARTGSVIIRGFEDIGTLNGKYNTQITVSAKEYTDAATSKKEYGISVEVKQEKGNYDNEHTSYIDYDEIESLTQGIDYISKVQNSVTKFSNFQADYTTKGDFKISTFSTGNKVMAAVSSGRIGGVTAYYDISELPKIKKLFETAKLKINAIK